MMRRSVLVFAALAAFTLPARAQHDYPNRPITLVIPLPPGGTNDIMARAVADKMSAVLGQQIVVENRASGGSGTVATRAVARGPADGYTLLLAYTSTMATGPRARRARTIVSLDPTREPVHRDIILNAGATASYGTVVEQEGNKLEIEFENGGHKRVLDSFVKVA